MDKIAINVQIMNDRILIVASKMEIDTEITISKFKDDVKSLFGITKCNSDCLSVYLIPELDLGEKPLFLNDSVIVRDSGIKNGSNIMINKVPFVIIEYSDDFEVGYCAPHSETIDDLKEKIRYTFSIKPEKTILLKYGKIPMEDGVIGDYKIEDEGVIKVTGLGRWGRDLTLEPTPVSVSPMAPLGAEFGPSANSTSSSTSASSSANSANSSSASSDTRGQATISLGPRRQTEKRSSPSVFNHIESGVHGLGKKIAENISVLDSDNRVTTGALGIGVPAVLLTTAGIGAHKLGLYGGRKRRSTKRRSTKRRRLRRTNRRSNRTASRKKRHLKLRRC